MSTMQMRERRILKARPLSLLAIATLVASPIAGQVTQTKRDSTVVLRMMRPVGGREDKLLLQLDSLRRVLDLEPLGSSDRAQLKLQVEKLVTALTALTRASGDIGARVGTDLGTTFSTALSRAMTEGGMGLHRFPPFAPRGWIGFTAEGPRELRVIHDTTYIRYVDYPSILSVEPNSPAERAGINAGDLLVAYDRADVRDHEINLSRLLIPDRRITVTVRRDGGTRDYEMTVARASEDYIRNRFEMNLVPLDSLQGDMPRVMRVPPPGSLPGQIRIEDMPRMASTRGGMIAVPRMALAAGPLWGAQLVTINSGLARRLGVGSGVLVTSVFQGTPASRSGLESGDIILKADGKSVGAVDQLQRITAEHSSDHLVDLEILRGTKPTKLTLRWAR